MSAIHAHCMGCGVKTSVTWVTVKVKYKGNKLLCAACAKAAVGTKLEKEVRK